MTNLGSRVTKAPKVAFVDTGLAAALLQLTPARRLGEPVRWRGLLESFVGLELLKQASWHPAGSPAALPLPDAQRGPRWTSSTALWEW